MVMLDIFLGDHPCSVRGRCALYRRGRSNIWTLCGTGRTFYMIRELFFRKVQPENMRMVRMIGGLPVFPPRRLDNNTFEPGAGVVRSSIVDAMIRVPLVLVRADELQLHALEV